MRSIINVHTENTASVTNGKVISILALGLCILLLFHFYTGTTLEDALITFRYARNLAQGSGFVFNDGERVLGTTTPLFTLMLAAGGWILGVIHIPLVALVVSLIGSLVAVFLVILTLKELKVDPVTAYFFSIFYFLSPFTMWSSTGGMETSLVILVMVILWRCYLKEQFILSGIGIGLLLLLRIDGLLWGGLIFSALLVKNLRKSLLTFLATVLIIAPWVLFAEFYFGNPIPQSVFIKAGIFSEKAISWHEILTIKEYLAGYFSEPFPEYPIIGLMLYLYGVFSICKRYSPNLIISSLFPLLLAFSIVLAHADLCPWYLVPAIWCILLSQLLGLKSITSLLFSNKKTAEVFYQTGLVFILFLSLMRGFEAAQYFRKYQANEDGMRKVVGLWLHDNIAPKDSVAMEAIGYQGYYSERTIIDLGGLVLPTIAELESDDISHGSGFIKMLKVLKPAAVVLRSFEVEKNTTIKGDTLFAAEEDKDLFEKYYKAQIRFSAPFPEIWGDLSYITIFQRNDR